MEASASSCGLPISPAASTPCTARCREPQWSGRQQHLQPVPSPGDGSRTQSPHPIQPRQRPTAIK
eukprot:5123282-Pyramimonas_sp.AAC.1